MLIVAVLLMSGGSGAHSVADHHAASKAVPCAVHQHHHDGDHHGPHECCCSSACPADLVMPAEPDAPHSVAYDLRLAPEPVSPLASRFPSPELDPPRPDAVS